MEDGDAGSGKAPLPHHTAAAAQTVSGTHQYMLQGYSLSKGIGFGFGFGRRHIASESFTVGGHRWAIYFYPNGKDPMDESAFVSVFVALASDAGNGTGGARARFQLTLVDQSGKGKHLQFRSKSGPPHTLKY